MSEFLIDQQAWKLFSDYDLAINRKNLYKLVTPYVKRDTLRKKPETARKTGSQSGNFFFPIKVAEVKGKFYNIQSHTENFNNDAESHN